MELFKALFGKRIILKQSKPSGSFTVDRQLPPPKITEGRLKTNTKCPMEYSPAPIHPPTIGRLKP